MRRLFLRAILVTILASCVLTALGVGIYGIIELSRSTANARNLVFYDVEKRFRIFGQLLTIAHVRMRGTAETALLSFDRKYPTPQAAFSATATDLQSLAKSFGVDELYVLDDDFVVRATSLPADLGLDLDQDRETKFSKFLKSCLGAGYILDHGLSLSLRTSRINGYYYYSPSGSDYILEASIGADTVLSRAFGESFYRNFLADLFIPMQTPSAEVSGADVFLFNGSEGVSFIGNKPDSFLNSDIISRLGSGERVLDRDGWVSTEYRAIPLDEIPIGFVKTVYVRLSFDRQNFYVFGVHVFVILVIIALVISVGSFFLSLSFFDAIFLRRLEALSSKIDAVANGDYGLSFEDARSDELSNIGADIERMVSGIVRNEERLRNAQRAELVAIFSGGIAHDFNNLLNTVAGAASLLEERAISPPPEFGREIKDTAELIRTAAARAGAMTRDLVSLSKGDNNRPMTPVDIGVLLSGVSRLFSRSLAPSIRFYAGPFPEGHLVRGDDSRLRQLFLNLFINAGQALAEVPDAGKNTSDEIRVSAKVLSAEEGNCRGLSRNGKKSSWYEVLISDTGLGIPREDRKRVFTPFYTTKSTGTGVGLSMALATAQAHGGNISLRDPETGGGAVFAVLLPLLDPDSAAGRESFRAP